MKRLPAITRQSMAWAVFYLCTLALLGIDSLIYPGFVAPYFIDTRVLALTFVIAAISMRAVHAFELPTILRKINDWLTFPVIGLTIFCAVIETTTYTNFIFSRTHIHYEHVFYSAFVMAITFLLHQRDQWFRHHKHTLLFLSPFALFGIALHMRTWPWDVFVIAAKEDSFIEYLQFFVLLASSITAVWKSTHTQRLSFAQRSIFFLAGALLFFVAGEEISWGQRILGLSTPESLSSINKQNEITIHNIGGIDENVFYAYVAVGLAGATSWFFVTFLPKQWQKFLEPFVPSWHLFGYYFAVLFYNLFALLHQHKHMIGEWSEPSELMLHLGILFTLLT